MWTGIEFLHVLQDIRLDIPSLEDIFLVFSSPVFYMFIPILLVMAIMWLYDKDRGEAIGLACVSAIAVSDTLKMIIQQPRPWVLDPTIEQVPGAHANGYSCPSGHTVMTLSTYPSAAWFFRKNAVSIILIVVAAMVVSGRLVLCVHTPLDILAAVLVVIVASFIAFKAVELGKRSERAYYLINAAYAIAYAAVAICALVAFDADVYGVLKYTGFFYGLLIGRMLEHRYVGYTIPERSGGRKVKVYVIGILVAVIFLVLPMVAGTGIGTFIGGTLMMVWCFYGYPRIMKEKGL